MSIAEGFLRLFFSFASFLRALASLRSATRLSFAERMSFGAVVLSCLTCVGMYAGIADDLGAFADLKGRLRV